MKSVLTAIVSVLILIAPALGQSAAALKRELRKRETEAKKEKTAEAFVEVAQWASTQGLAADAKRLFLVVLKQDPENEAANLGIGNEKFDGKWLPAQKAEELRKKALAAEYEAKGYSEVDGVWVPPDEVDDAKKGVFHHEGKLVSRDEKAALLAGLVYHPVTGLLIAKADLAKAEQGQFPIGREGRWADLAQANRFHADASSPWIVRSYYTTIATTLDMEKIESLKKGLDETCEKLGPVLGGQPLPAYRPTILIAATIDEYREFGNQFGDETSAASAFLMSSENSLTLPFQAPVRAGICTAHQFAMAQYYAQHALGLAFLNGKCQESGADLPLWFQQGVGALAGFYTDDRIGAHFCRTMVVVRGGVNDLRTFFNDFAINPDMEPEAINYNWTVAGLLLHFATKGGDQGVTDKMVAVTEAFKQGDGVEKAVKALQSALQAAEPKVAAHMQKLLDDNR